MCCRRAPPPTPRRSGLPWSWLGVAAAGAAVLALHLLFLVALDLRDFPGPAGILVVRDIVFHQRTLGWVGRMGDLLQGVLGDPLLSARMLMSLSTLGALAGLGLGAGAIGDRRSAAFALLVAATWVPCAHMGWSTGPGVVAWGLGWFGTGLTWWGARRQAPLGLAVGAGLVTLGIAIKPIAIPPVVFVLFAPLWSPGGWKTRLGVIPWLLFGVALVAPTAWLGVSADEPYFGGMNPRTARTGAGSLLDIPGGMQIIAAFPDRLLQHGRFGWLAALALVGLWPRSGSARGWRVVLCGATLAVLAATANALGVSAQPRYLMPIAFGLLVLAGIALAHLTRLRRLRGAGWALALGVPLVALFDTLAFAHAWSRQRSEYLDTEPHALPPVPALFHDHYRRIQRNLFMESSQPGALQLQSVVSAGPERGVASVRLRDRREAHGQIAAHLAGLPYLILSQKRCCGDDEEVEPCARTTVEAVTRYGTLLVLPKDLEGYTESESEWVRSLVQAAREERSDPYQETRWWMVWAGGEGEGPLPCPPPPRKKP